MDVGIDIVEINRFLDLCINYDLESIIFTQEEMSESIQRKAGYFAAKESVLKCLPPNVIIDFSFFRKIQIIKYRNGKPLVEFTDKYLQEQLKDWNFNLSISHDGDYAVAIAARNPRE